MVHRTRTHRRVTDYPYVDQPSRPRRIARRIAIIVAVATIPGLAGAMGATWTVDYDPPLQKLHAKPYPS